MAFSFKSKGNTDVTGSFFVEELLSNTGDWRDVPDIVKLTFKALADTVKSQGLALTEMERMLAGKATKAELTLALGNKANVTDVNQAISSLALAKDRGISVSTFDPIIKDKVSRAELNAFTREDRLQTVLAQYVPVQDLDTTLQDIDQRLGQERQNWTSALTRLGKEVADLARIVDSKADQTEIDRLNSSKANRQSVITALHSKITKDEFDSALSRKANVEHIETCVSELASLRASLDQLKSHENMGMNVNRLESEVARTRLALEDRLSNLENSVITIKNEFRSSLIDCTARMQSDLTQYTQTVARGSEGNKEIMSLRQELAGCVRAKDLYRLMETRNETEMEMRREIEGLVEENCCGMWLWTSGVLPTGGRVPWEVQASNSKPGNYIWREENEAITTVTPGLYEVSVGIYARIRPRATLALNDLPIARLGWDSDSVKLWSPHPDGNLLGLTYFDSFALPPNCRISLSVETQTRAEAFIRLRKL